MPQTPFLLAPPGAEKRNTSDAFASIEPTLTHEYIALGHALLAEHRGTEVPIHVVFV